MEVFHPEVNWLGHKVYPALVSSANVKSAWSYTSTPPTCLHDVMLKHRDNFASCILQLSFSHRSTVKKDETEIKSGIKLPNKNRQHGSTLSLPSNLYRSHLPFRKLRYNYTHAW
jgi:hypothetical protein